MKTNQFQNPLRMDPKEIEWLPQIRFSTGRQKDGYSIDRQESTIMETIARMGWHFDGIVIKDGEVCASQIDKTGRPKNFSLDAALGAFFDAEANRFISVVGKGIVSEAINRVYGAALVT